MNGKQAKMLRRHAERMTTGATGTEYKEIPHRMRLMVHPVFGQFYVGGPQRVLTADCTRTVYQRLKKARNQLVRGVR